MFFVENECYTAFLVVFKWLNLKIGSSFSISTAHVLASGWDQFVTNVLLLQGELHQVSSYFFREIAWKPNFSENCVFMENLSKWYFSEICVIKIGPTSGIFFNFLKNWVQFVASYRIVDLNFLFWNCKHLVFGPNSLDKWRQGLYTKAHFHALRAQFSEKGGLCKTENFNWIVKLRLQLLDFVLTQSAW